MLAGALPLGRLVPEVRRESACSTIARRRARRCVAALAPVGGATNECHGIQVVHPRCPGRGWSCPRTDDAVPALAVRAARASSAGSMRRRPRATCASASTAARRARSARRDDDAVRALPRRLDVDAGAALPAVARLRPGAGRRRPLDGLGARRDATGPVARVPHARSCVIGPGTVRFGRGRVHAVERDSSSAAGMRVAFRTKKPPPLSNAGHAARVTWSSARRSSCTRDPAERLRCRSTRTRSSRSARSARRDLRVAVLPARAAARAAGARPSRVWLDRRRARYAVAFTNLDLLASVVAERRRPWRRWVPLALFLLALAAASAALARPTATVSVTVEPARRSCCSSTSRARCAQTT